MRWLAVAVALAVLLAARPTLGQDCYTPAEIDGAMSVIHPAFSDRVVYDGVQGATLIAVWNDGMDRPKVDADTFISYAMDQSALVWAFKDNCRVWAIANQPLFLPLQFLDALIVSAERRMGPTS